MKTPELISLSILILTLFLYVRFDKYTLKVRGVSVDHKSNFLAFARAGFVILIFGIWVWYWQPGWYQVWWKLYILYPFTFAWLAWIGKDTLVNIMILNRPVQYLGSTAALDVFQLKYLTHSGRDYLQKLDNSHYHAARRLYDDSLIYELMFLYAFRLFGLIVLFYLWI